jgi:hypothetical protein
MGLWLGLCWAAAGAVSFTGSGGGTNIYNYTSNFVALSTESGFVSGRLGIGTNAPQAALHVLGGVLVEGNVTNRGQYYGDGSGLTNLDYFANHAPSNFVAVAAESGNFTNRLGVGTAHPDCPLHIVTSNGQWRFFEANYAPNFVVGHAENAIQDGAGSAVIAGGGYTGSPNLITGAASRYTVISGGYDNIITGIASVIGGGAHHRNLSTHGSIFGGSYNHLFGTSDYSVIGGGTGGIVSNSANACLFGGEAGLISGADYGVILGGYSNTVTAQFGMAGGKKAHVSAVGALALCDDSAPFTNAVTRSAGFRYTGGVRLEGSDLQLDNGKYYRAKRTDGVAAAILFVSSVTDYASIKSSGADYGVDILNSSAEPMVRVLNSGLVGIGTNAPKSKVHVNSGTITVDSGNLVLNGLTFYTGATSAPTFAAANGSLYLSTLGEMWLMATNWTRK